MNESLAHDLFVILAVGLVACLLCRRLNLSGLIGYLLTGIVIGKGGLGLVVDTDHEIEKLAELGVFLLLFAIGLEFSIVDLRRLGKSILLGGSIQMLLVAVPIMLVFGLIGESWRAAWLIGAAVAFSSTVLVFKALSERGDANTPHGRRAIGILLFQDAALIPLLLLVPLLTGTEAKTHWIDYLQLAVSSVGFVASIIALRRLLSSHVIAWLARSRSLELIILFTLVSLVGITLAAHSLGLPPSIGAFAAGLVFSGNRWTPQIDAIMLPFREVFSAIFFVSLGLLVRPALLLESPVRLAVLFILLIAVKTIAAMLALRSTGQNWRTSLGMGLGLSQVGEFAFVLAIIGVEADLIEPDTYETMALLATLSLAATPILIRLGLLLTRGDGTESEAGKQPVVESGHVIVIGAGPIGKIVVDRLLSTDEETTLIDLSPVNLHEFDQRGVRTIAGDASNPAILKLAGIGQAKQIVVSVPDDGTARSIVEQIRAMATDVQLIVRCRYRASIEMLRSAGADIVISEEEQATLAFQKLV